MRPSNPPSPALGATACDSPQEPAVSGFSQEMISCRAGAYPIYLGRGVLSRAGECLRHPGLRESLGTRCAVVTDENVARLHGEAACEGLRVGGFDPVLLSVPAGEASKSLSQTGQLCEAFAAQALTRRSFVVALGGGVIGDLAGFAAAIYLRGVPCVQVPTTVTAQVDSAYGGKTGVNTGSAKNQIGAFHPPVAVLVDPGLLGTLPDREFAEGCAEAIKHGAICDAEMLEALAAAPGSPAEMTAPPLPSPGA